MVQSKKLQLGRVFLSIKFWMNCGTLLSILKLSLSLSLKPCTCLVSQAESSKYNLLQESMLRYGLRLDSICVYLFYVDPWKEVLEVSAFVSFSFSRIFFLGFKELKGHHLRPGQLKTRQIWFQVPFWPMSFLCEWRTHFSIMDYWNGIIAGHFKIDQYGCTPFKLAL